MNKRAGEGDTNLGIPLCGQWRAQEEVQGSQCHPGSEIRCSLEAKAAWSGELGIPVAAKGEKDVQGHNQKRAQRPECGGGLIGSEQIELKSLPLRMSRPVAGM